MSSKGISARDAHRRPNTKDFSDTGNKRSDVAAQVAPPPSQDGKQESGKDNIVSIRNPGLRTAPPGYGLSRSRTGNDSAAAAAQAASVMSPIEHVLLSSQAGHRLGSSKPRPVLSTSTGKQIAQSSTTVEDNKMNRDFAERVRRKVKLHYIRSWHDMEAKELLYGKVASGMYVPGFFANFMGWISSFLQIPGSSRTSGAELIYHEIDRNLYVDATHLRGKAPSEVTGLIDMLAKPGGFEDTLSYVSLPVLSYTSEPSTAVPGTRTKMYDANERRQRESSGHEDKMVGRNSVVPVFDKLAEVGVCNILHLIVEEDTKPPPHTDSAIERAVSGGGPLSKRKEPSISVEVWYVAIPKRMEDVFSQAYCVLAASCAAGQHDGFLKPRQERKYLTLQQGSRAPIYVCEFMDDFQQHVLGSPSNKRGWVLQERALARRTIYFTDRQTYW